MKKNVLFFSVLSGVLFLLGTAQLGAVSVEGTWDFYYSWGCTGGYNHTTITFTFSSYMSTFVTGNGHSGYWYLSDTDEIQIHFHCPYTCCCYYGGNKAGGVMMGSMRTTGTNYTGCWYMRKQGHFKVSNYDEIRQVLLEHDDVR